MNNNLASAIEGKAVYILVIVVVIQFMYPITESGNSFALLLYQIVYMSFIWVGLVVARNDKRLTRLLAVSGILWIISTSAYVFNPNALWANIIGYIVYCVFEVAITWVLARYLFTTRKITRDVIYTAISIYLLLGAIFVPIYGMIESATFVLSDETAHAFVGGSRGEGEIFAWQDFNYYSYVTLTTLGYGDILPVTMLAKVAVSIEAIVGVLYLTIIMARLISLYSSDFSHHSEVDEHEL